MHKPSTCTFLWPLEITPGHFPWEENSNWSLGLVPTLSIIYFPDSQRKIEPQIIHYTQKTLPYLKKETKRSTEVNRTNIMKCINWNKIEVLHKVLTTDWKVRVRILALVRPLFLKTMCPTTGKEQSLCFEGFLQSHPAWSRAKRATVLFS